MILWYRKEGITSTFEVLYHFRVRRDCDLFLRPEDTNTLSWTDLPARYYDCYIHFTKQTTNFGLVIELKRGSQPKVASVYRPYKNRLCGKLEELTETERKIYFPSTDLPLLHLHGDPKFTIHYRLVDYCYNITLNQSNGTFEINTTKQLECTFKIHIIILTKGDFKLSVRYHAEPIHDIIQQCTAYGWIAIPQFCVSVVENIKMPWAQAEMECVRRGGHLISVRNDYIQQIVNKLLLNSPGYHDANAYWIGATDRTYEGDFRWSDGLPFSFTNWFPGWSQHGHYNRQPNDDGLSDQDCVELRQAYHLPSSLSRLAASFHWNDRDCSTPNYFICERLLSDEPVEEAWPFECNRTINLSRQLSRTSITSPGFPKQYPDNAHCEINIISPPGYRILLDFDELVLENEPFCSYDYLEILEITPDLLNQTTNHFQTASTRAPMFPSELENIRPLASTLTSQQTTPRRFCGDWSEKLKLLRHISRGSHIKLRFVSDYSHHFGGFKARVSMENAMACSDERLHLYNNSCYLFVSYPEVTWFTAQQICKGMKAQLASILSPEEEHFVTTNIRKTSEYNPNAIYWLGAKLTNSKKHQWIDGSQSTYTGWLPGQKNVLPEMFHLNSTSICLGIQWTTSSTPILPSGLYWQTQKCSNYGGYICKRRNLISINNVNFNKTLNGSEGRLTSPNYPNNYYNNLDYWVKIIGPERTRLVIQFSRLDVEYQPQCLYDYVELHSIPKSGDVVRWCGTYDTDMERFNFVSDTNVAMLRFHTDYSISGNGFSVTWHAIDVSGCPKQTLTAQEGVITSPNYPYFLLAKLDCSLQILAPSGRRIWLEITNYDINETNDATLEINLGDNNLFRPYKLSNHLNEGAFVSMGEKIEIRLQTSSNPPIGSGFRAIYKMLSTIKEDRFIEISNITYGTLLHLNYPMTTPANIDFTQHLVAPLGNVILIELFHVKFSDDGFCPNNEGIIEIYDNYADQDGTKWYVCMNPNEDLLLPPSPISITSYLNTLHIRQINTEIGGIILNGTVRVQPDINYKIKLLRFEDTNTVESCKPNPCQHNGKCISKGKRKICQCDGHFTGLFCALTVCELEPCVFGRCELTQKGYRCHCQSGYTGETCEQKQRPCESNPCESRGDCIDRGDTFHCRCHAWWEGPRCDKRMMNIPFKPLSERMLHEPFWLGLITVTVVLGVIGLVWCAKRHFPEKLEKLLAEEADRNRGGSSIRGSSLREQLACTAGAGGTPAAVMVMPSPQQGGCPRSLFGRLGIRKPSLLSLTSPHGCPGGGQGHPSAAATARTFSLDDLLKPLPRRTPSPRKKRNNSTPTKKNAAEKKQILQQLISPAGGQNRSRKVSLGELIQLSERKVKDAEEKAQNGSKENEDECTETNFSTTPKSTLTATIDDPKLEKKVTFARLLSKVSAEMSSGSEIELAQMKPVTKCSSTPPSPAADTRSPHSTSSNQGSDSFSSLEVSMPGTSGSITDFLNSRRNSRMGGRVKPASADSILAMFRNFSSTSAAANLPPSLLASPSTTPTASSPQDDVAGDDDSSSSSIPTPISFSSGPPDSPIMQKHSSHNIEVSVLNPHNSQRSSTNNNLLQPPTILLEIPSTINKCLSPIHEVATPLPTPKPSPAPTPMRQRSPIYSSAEDVGMDCSEDHISIEISGMSVSISDDEDEDLPQDIAIDPQAEDGLLQEEAAAMAASSQATTTKLKARPTPITQGVTAVTINPKGEANNSQKATNPPPPLIIPTLTIQQPSPTHRSPPSLLFPGSPPPQRAIDTEENTFGFSGSRQQKRGLLKEFDKPTSLDLPCPPPMITITCNLSEAESDAESISPATKSTGTHLNVGPSSIGNVGMCYLSPFSMCSRNNDRTASESNLSSSGYSSMASPGPSRCGSNNPLCPSEMEDPGSSGPGSHLSSITPRRPSPLLKTSTSINNSNSGDGEDNNQGNRCRGRSDSETLSDDQLLESNDEGIGTDHIDEKIEEGELKSAKELEVFISNELGDETGKTILNLPVISTPPSLSVTNCTVESLELDKLVIPPISSSPNKSLQLPSIVVQGDKTHLSPVSSRSESPLSDKTVGLGRFSPHNYCRHKDYQLPFTDSDGLYDFPSSDLQNSKLNISATGQQHRKSTGRRREKKQTKPTLLKTPSPTRAQVSSSLSHLLDIPGKDPSSTSHCRIPAPRKLSPKRRIRTQQHVSSSSSSESLHSARELKVSSSSPSPDTIRWPSLGEWPSEKKTVSNEASGEETAEDARSSMLTKEIADEFPKSNRKISRLRTISHQIRFLRRLEQSLKRRERLVSLSDSGGDDDDDDQVTSPLLHSPKGSRPKIRKSSSIGKLHTSNTSSVSARGRQYKQRAHRRGGSQLLIPQDDRTWSKVPISGNGFSD
ncbi:uncharacterized protein LOC123298714 [Chrysoperla carnea]|uniref:uncharacterized protein LOC123298714 n=1 Tax=Chrysoperla carnea TaxID=189513 RepID=UPI001D097832|nr:uncharacterized protein LOC123298714 [Chrysoperla carnea]